MRTSDRFPAAPVCRMAQHLDGALGGDRYMSRPVDVLKSVTDHSSQSVRSCDVGGNGKSAGAPRLRERPPLRSSQRRQPLVFSLSHSFRHEESPPLRSPNPISCTCAPTESFTYRSRPLHPSHGSGARTRPGRSLTVSKTRHPHAIEFSACLRLGEGGATRRRMLTPPDGPGSTALLRDLPPSLGS